MFKYQFHEKWVLPFVVILSCTFSSIAQCPITKPAYYAMVPQGLPTILRLDPTDFLVNLADTAEYLDLTISEDRFLCKDLGIREIILSGRTLDSIPFSCREYVWVYDSVFLCDNKGDSLTVVGGKIYTEQNQPVSNISIGLSSGSANYFIGTEPDGTFYFEDLEREVYQLTPTNLMDDNVRNGISTFDIILLQKHILGIRPLDSPYKIIAADLNSSGGVTAFDLIILRQLILSIILEFPNTPSWKFVDADFVFENEKDPFLTPYPTSNSLDMRVPVPQLDNRFIAIKMGDIDNSASLNPTASGRDNNNLVQVDLKIEEQTFKRDEIIKVPFYINENLRLAGLQFSLSYNAENLELLNIAGDLPLTKSDYFLQNGKLNLSWVGLENVDLTKENTPILLTFSTKKSGKLSEMVTLDKQRIQPEMYSDEDQRISFGLDWEQKLETTTSIQVFDNYPNPFSSTTILPFSVSENTEVALQIFNANGQLITTQHKTVTTGNHQLEIGQNLTHSGIYFYQLQSDLGVASGRLNFVGN